MKKTISAFGNEVTYEENFWTGKRVITINGTILTKVKRNVYTDGTQNYTIKGNYYTGVKLIGQEHSYVIYDKFNALEYIATFLPLIVSIIWIGGIVGVLLGFLALYTLTGVARSTKNTLVTILGSVASIVVIIVVGLVLAMLLQPILPNTSI